MKHVSKNLVAQAITRGLECEALPAPAAEHRLRGRAIFDLDCTLTKGEDTDARPALKCDWPAVVAYLLWKQRRPVEQVIATVRNAMAQVELEAGEVVRTYQAAVTAAIDEKKATLERVPKAGPIKVAGKVDFVGFVES
jgi:hypothetical protein